MLTPKASQPIRDFAADVRSADGMRLLNKQDPKAASREVARQFEALLVQQMMKSMREATPQYDEFNNSATDMFRGMYDQQLSQTWTRAGGTGLADSIVRQIEIQTNPALLNQAYGKKADPFVMPFQTQVQAQVQASLAAAKSAAEARAGSAKNAGGASGFLDRIGAAADTAAGVLGVSPALLVAHAALETGWGKKPITDAAGQDSHNLFGIKATPDWKGRTVDITTTEYVGGVPQKRVETFRAYDSYTEAFADYAGLIQRRYKSAMSQGDNASAYGAALQAGGYATDPNYANKLARVANVVARFQDTSRIG
ncbi:flagellar assembly peptidoglycan hydrolase FlgJ [Chitiniphilus eburneus]|uniref:Peptidoglycan hydrolase FlgJ n=1 Tax=Chitiniphilus eburneus TaxID=2571148 RepID=A0A4U0PYU6_9NEIS|nr:flagellar assembly peptidoglycan hydrolase FlgJ [Chitiniphilus eburneus]TJZ73823.1 flagellar assembly peptidoglycan hydrolase FlgJ [Chitiniphilus eburneus]